MSPKRVPQWKINCAMTLLVACAAMLGSDAERTQPGPKGIRPEVRRAPVAETSPAGEVGILTDGHTVDLPCPTDEINWIVFLRYVKEGDKELLKLMLRQGDVLMVQQGTPVQVIKRDGERMEVRLLSGTHEGKTCLVVGAWVRNLPKQIKP